MELEFPFCSMFNYKPVAYLAAFSVASVPIEPQPESVQENSEEKEINACEKIIHGSYLSVLIDSNQSCLHWACIPNFIFSICEPIDLRSSLHFETTAIIWLYNRLGRKLKRKKANTHLLHNMLCSICQCSWWR